MLQTPYFPDSERRKKIFAIALPIIGGMVSQNILNLVDIAMVGHLGDVALASTGIGSFANFMSMALILGLSVGVQAIASRRNGEGRHSEMALALDGGLLLALIIGTPLAIIVFFSSEWLFPLLSDDPAVQETGTGYLQVRVLAVMGVGMNFAFRGYLSAVQRTANYFKTILVMHSTNIFLNWVFIFGNLGAPELGVYGAGLATTLSIYFGTLIYFLVCWRTCRREGFMHGLPSKTSMWQILTLSMPTSFQNLFYAAGSLALFWIIGKIGTAELAAANVLVTLTLVVLLPTMGFGLAAASLVGHALGRGDRDDAYLWGWNVATLAASLAAFTGLILLLFHRPVLELFIHQAETVSLAVWPMIITGLMIWFDAIGLVMMQSQLGAGDSRRMMMISLVSQWLIQLPLAYLIGPVLGYGLLGVWLVYGSYRILQASLFIHYWRKKGWATVEV